MLTAENVPVPFFADVNNGLPHGGQIEIIGDAIYGQSRGIWVEYKTRDGEALHLNIRMGQNNQHVIIANSYHRGHWGHEEKQCLSVKPGGPLHISIECRHNHYDIIVNGRSFKFPYRLRTREVNRLEIRGDLLIRRLNMHKMEGHIQLMNTYPIAYPQPYAQPYPAQAPMGQSYYPPLSQPYVPQLQPSYPNQQYPGLGQPPPTYYRS